MAAAQEQTTAQLPVGSAMLTEWKGEVSFHSPAGDVLTPDRGLTLEANSTIETQKGSVVLNLQDGSQILVKSHARVVLRSPTDNKGYFLELLIGNLVAKVKKRVGEAPGFKMGTPSAVIAVRGTRFEVDVDKKGKTYVQVFEGMVEVRGFLPSSQAVFLRPGFSSQVDQEHSPSEPREMYSGTEGENQAGRQSEGLDQQRQGSQEGSRSTSQPQSRGSERD
jgi:hypothetical protein